MKPEPVRQAVLFKGANRIVFSWYEFGELVAVQPEGDIDWLQDQTPSWDGQAFMLTKEVAREAWQRFLTEGWKREIGSISSVKRRIELKGSIGGPQLKGSI